MFETMVVFFIRTKVDSCISYISCICIASIAQGLVAVVSVSVRTPCSRCEDVESWACDPFWLCRYAAHYISARQNKSAWFTKEAMPAAFSEDACWKLGKRCYHGPGALEACL